MTNLLDKILSVLPQAQQAAINSLISRKKKTNEITSIRSQQSEITRIYNSIKAKLGTVILSPKYAVAGEKISSADHNKNMESIFLDLNALYSNIDQIGKLSLAQSATLESEYQKSKAAVEKLINDAKIFSLRKKYQDFNEIKIVDFNSTRNLTQQSPKAEVNPKTRLLQPKQLDSTRAHLINRNARITKVYTKTRATGIKGSLSKSFPPNLMVDQRPETFWATVVMADGPISQLYDKQTRAGGSAQVVVDGPVVEVYFKFSHVERINHIRLLPFSNYPIKVLDISYRPSINSVLFYSLEDFIPSSTLDWEEYNFKSIYAHEVKITIAQENYKQSIYQLPKSIIKNTDVFQRIYDANLSKLIGNELIDSDFAVELLKTVSNYESAIQALESLYSSNTVSTPNAPSLESFYDFNRLISNLLSDIDPEISKESVFIQGEEFKQEIQDPLVEIRKFEYLLGIREVEMGYAIYSPISYYESEKFDLQATASEIQIEVDERHIPYKTQWEDNHYKSSTEWSLDIGGGREIPIHPRNIVRSSDNIPAVKDELIAFTQLSGAGYTRLGGLYSAIYSLKKEGQLIPETDYVVSRIPGAIPKLKIELTGSQWYDPNGIYTVDYAVDPDSYRVQILNRYDSELVPTPDKFTSIGSNNEVTLSKFPFINYEVINLTGYFSKNSSTNGWSFIPPQPNLTSGQLRIFPTIIDSVGNVLQTGNITGNTITGAWGSNSGEAPLRLNGNTSLSSTYFGTVNGVQFGYFTQIMDSTSLYQVSGFPANYTMTFNEPPVVTVAQLQSWDSLSTGVVFSGVFDPTPSGYLLADYTLGIGCITDDQIFALGESTYSPITVTVGSRVAKNITDYEKFEHPAFSISTNKNTEYEYIQAGKTIYLNTPVNGQEVKVSYRWITDYIKLGAILRINQRINPDSPQKINEVRVLINNMII